jgi:hypothetical protein
MRTSPYFPGVKDMLGRYISFYLTGLASKFLISIFVLIALSINFFLDNHWSIISSFAHKGSFGCLVRLLHLVAMT